MAYLVFWLAFSFGWYGVCGVLVGIIFWLRWHICCFDWCTCFFGIFFLFRHVQSGCFRILCGKKYASWKKVHQRCWWRWWQITAMWRSSVVIFICSHWINVERKGNLIRKIAQMCKVGDPPPRERRPSWICSTSKFTSLVILIWSQKSNCNWFWHLWKNQRKKAPRPPYHKRGQPDLTTVWFVCKTD